MNLSTLLAFPREGEQRAGSCLRQLKFIVVQVDAWRRAWRADCGRWPVRPESSKRRRLH